MTHLTTNPLLLCRRQLLHNWRIERILYISMHMKEYAEVQSVPHAWIDCSVPSNIIYISPHLPLTGCPPCSCEQSHTQRQTCQLDDVRRERVRCSRIVMEYWLQNCHIARQVHSVHGEKLLMKPQRYALHFVTLPASKKIFLSYNDYNYLFQPFHRVSSVDNQVSMSVSPFAELSVLKLCKCVEMHIHHICEYKYIGAKFLVLLIYFNFQEGWMIILQGMFTCKQ